MEFLFSAIGLLASHLPRVWDFVDTWMKIKAGESKADASEYWKELQAALKDREDARRSLPNRSVLILRFAFSTCVLVVWALDKLKFIEVDWNDHDYRLLFMISGFWFGDGIQLWRG